MSGFKLKDPNADLDWTFDWGDGYLLTSSPVEEISTSSWSIAPAPPSPAGGELEIASSPGPSKTATTATAWVTGGVKGRVYRLTNEIVTTQGRKDRRSIMVRIGEK